MTVRKRTRRPTPPTNISLSRSELTVKDGQEMIAQINRELARLSPKELGEAYMMIMLRFSLSDRGVVLVNDELQTGTDRDTRT